MRRTFPVFLFVLIGSSSLLLAFFALSAFPVRAQVAGTNPISLDIQPQYPAPYQNVTLTPSSSVFDVAAASISITVNGTAFYKGSGGSAVTIPMGGPGSTANISVSAIAGGQTYHAQLVIRPADVALVVEPLSTAHPFYEGHGLVSSNGRVRLIAIPDLRSSSGKAISPSTLEYTWKLGDQILESDSGIGKSVLNANAPQQYRDANVSVTVTDPASSAVAQTQTTISPIAPLVRIYENDPLLGPLYDNALSGNITMSGTENTYRGVPYYFSSLPSIGWGVNSVQSGSASDITVRATGNGQGTAVVNFAATSRTDASRSANTTLSVIFGQKSAGIFGL
ncbi:hypothetical protein H0X32_03815 [Patescibacteria group bacterium]|nr:hypothetical protein [Patescibacteria group bacterium]